MDVTPRFMDLSTKYNKDAAPHVLGMKYFDRLVTFMQNVVILIRFQNNVAIRPVTVILNLNPDVSIFLFRPEVTALLYKEEYSSSFVKKSESRESITVSSGL